MSTASTQSQSVKPKSTREEHLSQHLGLVYHVARQISRARTMDLELDELVSAGTLGLIEAFNNFDQSRGLAFSTFAAPRIRGAMLDEMRRQDHVPRSVRRRAREVTSATEALTRELGHVPEPSTVARRMGIDVDTYFRWQWEGDGAHFVPLERTAESTTGSRVTTEHHEAAIDPEIDERLTHQQEVTRLYSAIAALPPTERQVLSLYYFEDLKLSEIAQILRVSESRVSQIRGRAVARLRDAVGSLRTAVA